MIGEALKLEKFPERDPESFGNFFKRAEPGVQRFAGFEALVIAVVKTASFRHIFLCELKLLAETAQAACKLESCSWCGHNESIMVFTAYYTTGENPRVMSCNFGKRRVLFGNAFSEFYDASKDRNLQ